MGGGLNHTMAPHPDVHGLQLLKKTQAHIDIHIPFTLIENSRIPIEIEIEKKARTVC